MAPATSTNGRLLPNGWTDVVRQLVLIAGAYYAYNLVRGVVDGSAAVAFQNARSIVDAELALGLFVEPTLQSWALGHAWLIDAASFVYVNSHFVVTSAFLVWLYLARNHAFYFVRNMLMIAMGLALCGYTLFPTAPPRMLPEWGFSDTVVAMVGENAARGAEYLYNPFAAVPSMHVAFALMVGISAALLVRSRVARIAWLVYPALVTFAVVVTGNHFWLDAVAGATVAGVAAYAANAGLARARPHVWSFGAEVPAEASA